MASWRHSVLGLALLALAGCSVGQGQGEIQGAVTGPDFCGLGEGPYELSPSFFSAEVIDDHVVIRVQRGSAMETVADGMMIHVHDIDEVQQNRLGLPIPVGTEADSLVQVVLYLNETCPSGFPNQSDRRRPVILEAMGGTVTFDAVYAPNVDPAQTLTEARLEGLTFADPAEPEERNAVIDGWFSFFYQRGSPAQRFP